MVHTPKGLFLSQHQYIIDVLQRPDMAGAKESIALMSTSTSLSLFDGTNASNVEHFRKIVRSLQYLSLTRHNIAYPVNKHAQFMHKLRETHFHCP